MGHETGLDAVVKKKIPCPCRESNPVTVVAILTNVSVLDIFVQNGVSTFNKSPCFRPFFLLEPSLLVTETENATRSIRKRLCCVAALYCVCSHELRAMYVGS
jgi:hypothetical protein